ncbi:S-adenosylmethionine:tRNA ribosyltransferase-isomerase [soil metagenome]
MHTQKFNINEFDYELPSERIAEKLLEKRNHSKLLVYDNKTKCLTDKNFSEIPELLPENSIMVINDSKVVYARLLFENSNGAVIEIFCIEPFSPTGEMSNALLVKGKCVWKCLIGNRKKWKEEILKYKNEELELHAKLISSENNENLIEFIWDEKYSFGDVLHFAGNVPLPPYIKRKAEEIDKKSYQTIYADKEGSVAAPTAGLHFTEKELQKIKNRNISIERLDLNVGAGTFLPVKTIYAEDHNMHSEKFYIKKELIKELLKNKGKVISTGTTTLRALESLYWIGIKMINENDTSINSLSQWEYKLLSYNDISLKNSLIKIRTAFEENNCEVLEFKTSIMITPGYKFKAVNILITNFHQPKSTLLLLVSAFTDNNWKMIYEHALKNNYRFLSYGDSSLLFL